ncbi:MAG: class I SAM-dependent methyltransferase [Candidatus Omnitrophica bacterium]|nr:class I SAM-dependent methyltransferase [Candidatus Omnitrophota bacterium]
MMPQLLDFLRLPESKTVRDSDSAETTVLHRQIIQKKPFLRELYADFYRMIKNSVPDIESKFCVDIGSGAGFIKEFIPHVVTSDVVDLPHVDRCFSAVNMPFEDRSVDVFFLIDVFHHLPDGLAALKELNRCLKPGGRIVMIEPANTFWGRIIYQNFHHEDFDLNGGWQLKGKGRLSSANIALPWIFFVRDRKKIEQEIPALRLKKMTAHTPFLYLFSGGFTMRQLLPSWAYPIAKGFEFLISPLNPLLGMFYFIEIEKIHE